MHIVSPVEYGALSWFVDRTAGASPSAGAISLSLWFYRAAMLAWALWLSLALLRETEGLALITSGIANLSTPTTIEPIVAFGVGLVSVYSSTSGVVLPAFLPMVPDLAARLGGLEPLPIALSMNVAASLVDLSSLSTGGALFIAGAAGFADTRKLFNQLLAWGMSMTLVGAVLCYVLFG